MNGTGFGGGFLIVDGLSGAFDWHINKHTNRIVL